MIFEAQLPISSGCVEVLDDEGNPTLIKTPEQFRQESKEQESQRLRDENATLKEQQAQSDEAAISAFEAQAATDEAIIALYEKIGG